MTLLNRNALLEIMRCGEVGNADPVAIAEAIELDLRARLPASELTIRASVSGSIEILRDQMGIPHIFAETSADLFFGLGFAMAQDRLWQMDILRRRGLGRLSEVLGSSSLSADIMHRTIGLDRFSEMDAAAMSESTHEVLAAFTGGINRWIEESGRNRSIEFDLLGYDPEPWRPVDVFAALRGFWWQLNGRLASIVAGEACLRTLPEGPLLDAIMTPEFSEETIVPPKGSLRSGSHTGSDDGRTGSNNWAVGGNRTRTGAGVLGSDPHLPFGLPSTWYECRLVGPDDDVVGAAFAGAPGLFFGRNRHLAWGLTNNNTSLRDLYKEEVDPDDSDAYLDGSAWAPFKRRTMEIAVRDSPPETLIVRETSRGPIVNHLLSPVDPDGDPPLSLRWVGQQAIDNVGPLVAMNRARDWQSFRAALKSWVLPTFNWVVADTNGSVGYQCTASIPVRGRITRGYRQANHPDDTWLGFANYEAIPRIDQPASGYVDSANNRTAPVHFPVPMYGTFAPGDRALRIRAALSDASCFDSAACRLLQLDTFCPYAERLTRLVLENIASSTDPNVALFTELLSGWDFHYDLDSTPPVLYETFRQLWFRRVCAERFPEHLVAMVTGMGSAATASIEDAGLGWFAGDVETLLVECVREAVEQVRKQYGPEPEGWQWGKIHLAHFRHPLSNTLTAPFFDIGPLGISGGASTVRNTGLSGSFGASSGSELQFIADLAPGVNVMVCQNLGQSGQPGSPHYQDQFPRWIAGDYHEINSDRAAVEVTKTGMVRIDPLG